MPNRRQLDVPGQPLLNDKLGLLSDVTSHLSDKGRLEASAIDGVIDETNGGTGESRYSDGQILIGNGTSAKLDKANLTAGANVVITNGPGSVTIAAIGSGNVTGPGSSTNNDIALFNGTTGGLLKDAGKGVPTGTIVGTTDSQTLSSKTLATPIITDFSAATHTHQNSVNGGTLDVAAISSGTLPLARGGTNADLSATGGASQVLKQVSGGAAVTVGQLASTDISGLGTLATQNGTFSGTSSGTNTGDQTIALTGDVTGSGTGSFVATLANIPAATPAAGSIVHANIAAPSSPAAGKVATFSDSTDLRFHDKNASGVIGTTVVADTGASNNFLTAISAAGAISKAQPSFSNLSGSVATTQMPALTGDVTTSAGFVATTIAANAVTDAKLRQGGALSVIGRSANSTGNVADISAASDNTVLRRSGTTLAFGAVDVSTAQVTGIMGSANGGTGNGFAKLSGPTTSEKTFTLPNASCTVLTTNAAVTEVQGGTNQTTYTLGDVLYSSAANTLSKLAGNTTSTKKFLTQTGTGTVSAAPSWVQPAAADLSNGVSGSGAVVLVTSPTLVTPALGVATATSIDVAGFIRATVDSPLPSSGAGVEITYGSGTVNIRGYDRSASAYKLVVFNDTVTIGAASGNITGVGTLSMNSTLAKYNNVATAGAGMAAVFGNVAVVTQAASIGTTNLYASAPAGMYRVSWTVQVTRAASSSSSVTVTIGWNNGSAKTSTVGCVDGGTPASSATPTNTLNSTASGEVILVSAASQNITYATTYASTGGTSMQYSLSVVCERIQ